MSTTDESEDESTDPGPTLDDDKRRSLERVARSDTEAAPIAEDLLAFYEGESS